MLAFGAPAAVTVFERLGEDLWLLVPAFLFAMLGSALIGRVLGVRRTFSANVLSGLFGFGIGVAVSLLVAGERGKDASEGFARNLFLFTLFGASPRGCGSSSWRDPARWGGADRSAVGASPIRSLKRRSRRVRRYAEITRIAARNGLGPSLGLGPKDDFDGKRPPPVRRLRLALEQCGGMFVKLGQILSTRTDLLPADVRELSQLQDNVPPAPGRRDRRTVGGRARSSGR